MLVVGSWLLVVGSWLLVVGCWLLVSLVLLKKMNKTSKNLRKRGRRTATAFYKYNPAIKYKNSVEGRLRVHHPPSFSSFFV